MVRIRLGLAVLVVVGLSVRAGAGEPPPLLSGHGVIEKAGKDSLSIKLRGDDGKFGKSLVLKITGTSKVTTLIPQMRKDTVVITQKDTDAKDLQPKQTIALLYTMVKSGPVLLSAVVQPPAGK